MSFEEYLFHEDASPARHEFHDGGVTMMASGNRPHAEAAANWMLVLGALSRGGECKPLGSDMGVWISSAETALYPEVALYCGVREYRDEGERFTTNPRLIAEVLSASTRDHDLSMKLELYKRIPSLEQHFCMEPDRVEVHGWTKTVSGAWRRERDEREEDEFLILSLGQAVKLRDLYNGLL
jgi:Uma2 family endonuclease